MTSHGPDAANAILMSRTARRAQRAALCVLALLAACAGDVLRPASFERQRGVATLHFRPAHAQRSLSPRPYLPCNVEIRGARADVLRVFYSDITEGRYVELNPGKYSIVVSSCRLCHSGDVFEDLRFEAKRGGRYHLLVVSQDETPERITLGIAIRDEAGSILDGASRQLFGLDWNSQ
jgi:hypothetical protein